jgi:hypothetical protein
MTTSQQPFIPDIMSQTQHNVGERSAPLGAPPSGRSYPESTLRRSRPLSPVLMPTQTPPPPPVDNDYIEFWKRLGIDFTLPTKPTKLIDVRIGDKTYVINTRLWKKSDFDNFYKMYKKYEKKK